jgi:hypothetical protein
MPPYAPEVLTGMRAPRTVRLEEARAREAAATPESTQVTLPPSAPGTVVYVSKFRRYRVQITAPTSYIDPTTGRRVSGGKRLEAQFEDGVYRNTSKDPAIRKLIDEALQSNPHFGAFGSIADYWLASDQESKMQAARVASALDTLKTLPKETVEQYVAALKQGTAEDHELPPAAEARGSIRPIPSPQP